MHLISKTKVEPTIIESATPVIKSFVDNPDGSSTIVDFTYPESVGTIDDWSVESLQNAGVAVDVLSGSYIHPNFVDGCAVAEAAASKLGSLVSEAEVKELNNLE